MMNFSLRQYQEEAVTIAVDKLKNGSKPFVICASVGAGKSIIIAEICHRLDEPVLILQPSKELLEQNYSKLKSYGIDDISMYSASVGVKKISKYTYATIGSIKNKVEDFKHFRYILIDEVEMQSGNGSMMRKFIDAIKPLSVCGLTATPYRMSQKYERNRWGMLECSATLMMINRIAPFYFREIAYKIETQELIDAGYLSPIEYFVDKEVDTSDLVVNSTGADYTVESLEKYADKILNRTVEVVVGIDKRKLGKRTLVFCSSIRRANRTAELLSDNGIDSMVVTSDVSKKERERIVNDYRSGKLKVLINVGIFLAGLDVPEIDCIVYSRPTLNVRVFYQALGRGVRLDPSNPDKVLKVYDLSKTLSKLGRIEKIRLGKEDGYKDCLYGEHGRLDNVQLYKFKIKGK